MPGTSTSLPIGTTAHRNPCRAASRSLRAGCDTLRTSPVRPISPKIAIRPADVDALEAADAEKPFGDVGTVIIHAQMAREDQLDRMEKVGAIPSFFVLHTYYWGDRHHDIFMGPERAARMSPVRSALDRDLHPTLHADSPVVPMEPLRIVWSAVNRQTTGGRILGEDQRVTVMEALAGVTIDAARQHFEDDRKGSLEVGKFADLVILSQSPLDVAGQIDEIEVVETIVGGETIYHRDDP